MKQPMLSKGEQEDDQLNRALAVLISCTRNKNRPLSLTEVAKWLELAVRKLGSYTAVADRVGLSSKMLRQFSNVENLSGPVKKLFENRAIDSVDAATHLAMLPSPEQRVVAERLASGKIDTSDIRAVIQLRRTQPIEPIRSLINRVIESKTTREYVAEFVVRGARTKASILASFRKYIPASDIIRLELVGSLGRLVLTQKGKQTLAHCARAFGIPLKHVIPIILQGQKR